MTEQITATMAPDGLTRLGLRVQVPAAVVNETYARVLQNMRRKVQVAGYRVGKAPLPAVRRQVGNRLERLVTTQLIEDNTDKALQARGLSSHSSARDGYAYDEAVEGQAFEFRVPLPDMSVKVTKLSPLYKNLELLLPARREDFDAAIEERLQLFLSQHAASEERREGEHVEHSDRVTFSCTVSDEQQPQPDKLCNGQTQVTIVGVDDELPGEITRSLHSMCCGATRRISRIIKVADGWEDLALEGQKTTFDLKIHKLERLLLPELSDELVQRKMSDVPSVEALRCKLKQELQDEEKQKRRSLLERQMESALLATSEVTVPQPLLDVVANSLSRQIDDGKTPLPQRETVKQQRLPRVRETIAAVAVLQEIAHRENIVIDTQTDSAKNDYYRTLHRAVTKHLSASAEANERNKEAEYDAAFSEEDDGVKHFDALLAKLRERSQLQKLAKYKGITIALPISSALARATESRLAALRHEYASYHLTGEPFTPALDRRIVVTRFVTVGDRPVEQMTLLRSSLVLVPPDDGELPPYWQVFVGMRAGEEKRVPCPGLFPEAEAQGFEVEIAATLHEVQVIVLPTLDDQFAREFLDTATMAVLRDKVRVEVAYSQEKMRRRSLRERILDNLVDTSEFRMDTETVAEAVAAVRRSEALQDAYDEGGQGPDEEIDAEHVHDTIVRNTKYRLVAAEIAQQENIAYEDNEDEESNGLLSNVKEFLLKETVIVDDSDE